MQKASFFTALVFLSLSACSGKTLDGGTTGDTTGAGAGAGAGSGEPANESGPGGTAGVSAEIPDAPVVGQIGGRPFEAKRADVTFSKRNNQWFLSLANYGSDCGSSPSGTDTSEALVVNVGSIEPAAGTFAIAYADSHGASLQIGVFDTTEKSDTRPVQTGTVRLDNWDETPGATITGGLKLVADDESAVGGTFTAKVCAPR